MMGIICTKGIGCSGYKVCTLEISCKKGFALMVAR